MSLSFPISKSFYKADNLFKHDFLLRESFDTVDLLWYRTHEGDEGFTDSQLRSLDEADINKLNRTLDNCPDNELKSLFNDVLYQLEGIQYENEIFDFYYEFYYVNTEEIIRDDLLLQRRNDIIRELRIIESDELSSDYIKFWDYVYEKSAIKAIISPIVWGNSNLTTVPIKKGDMVKNKAPSDGSDVTVTKNKETVKQSKCDDSASLMNARFLLQQIIDKGLDEDKMTYVNIFADDEDEEEDYETPSSATLSAELESMEASGSRLTEISFEKETTLESDTGMKDPFKDKSYDCLFYLARTITEHVLESSNMYFIEAPVILLENDLVVEMKEREKNYLVNFTKLTNHYVVKMVGLDGVEGFNGILFRQGMLRMTDQLISKMESIKQEGVKAKKDTKYYNESTESILRAPNVGLSDYRKLINFDMPTEEVRRLGQRKKINQFKTMVCLAGRTKLRKYDYSEKITNELNNIKFPIKKIAHLTSVAREHATATISGYMDSLVRLIRKRKFFEDYPDDMYTRMHVSVDKTKEVLTNLEKLKEDCTEAKKFLAAQRIYKPFGHVKRVGSSSGQLNNKEIKQLLSQVTDQTSNQIDDADEIEPCFTPGLNLIMEKVEQPEKTFKKTAIASNFDKSELSNKALFDKNVDNFEAHGFPLEYWNIMKK